MKKIFTLIATAMLTIAAQAQVVFVDHTGKEYANGETMTILPTIDEEWGDVTFEAPSFKNNGAQAVNVAYNIEVKDLPEMSSFQVCYPIQCKMFSTAFSFQTEADAVEAGKTRSTGAEWVAPIDEETGEFTYGQCSATYTLYVNGEKGNTVTVNFIYANTDGIKGITADAASAAAYSISGVRVNGNQKGISIVKTANGVRKVVY